MTEIRKRSIFILVLAALLAGSVLLVGDSVKKYFIRQRSAFEQELYVLPFFVPAVEQQRIRADFGLDDKMLTGNFVPLETLNDKIVKTLATAVDREFPKGGYAAAIKARQREITPAKPGDKVKFDYIRPEDHAVIKVAGTFEMREKTAYGVTVVIDGKFYRLRQVAPACRYLFDESAAVRLMADMSRTFKAEYVKRKSDFIRGQRQELETKAFREAGYMLYLDGRWLPAPEIMNLELERRRKLVLAARDKQLKEILGRYTLFGAPMFKLQTENW